MTQGQLKIHSENILPLIKKSLYSDRDIFIRELISNACDACQKRKILREKGEDTSQEDAPKVELKVDSERKALIFEDTGLGLDAEEIERYIANVAFSGAEEFMKHYETDREKDQIIGHFGLGFFSAYMVAKSVEIDSLSYKEGAKPVRWTCDGSADYDLEEGSREKVGTTITLFLDEESEDLLDPAKLRAILNQHCSFLPFPIFLNDSQINEREPLWVRSASELKDEDYLQFFRHLYPGQEDPLFWIHLNVEYPFHLRGILYFPRLQKNFDLSQNTIKLFCNRVFVTDDCRDLIPEYLMVLRGAIDSPDIPLNVSRSQLQMDRTVRQLSSHISKKVSDRLTVLHRNEPEAFHKIWKDVEVIIKLGAIQDDKFYERVKDLLKWQTVEGEWTTTEEYLERNKEKLGDKVFYSLDGVSEGALLTMYQEKGIEVLKLQSFVDQHLISFLETKTSAKFQRLDGGLDEALVDKENEETVLDAEGRTAGSRRADFFRQKLGKEGVEVEAKSLVGQNVPAFVVFDENSRRMRDFLSAQAKGEGHNFDEMVKRSFVINSNSPLISAIERMDEKNPELAGEMVHELYDLALLGQREMDPAQLQSFIERTGSILEKLSQEQS